MVAKPFDLDNRVPPDYDNKKWGNPIAPKLEVLLEHAKVNFDYEETVLDRGYKDFYHLAKGRPVYYEIPQFYRVNKPGKGEYLLYNVSLRGEDWKGNRIGFDYLEGRYDKPIFRYERDPQTNESKVTEIVNYERVYTVPFSPEKFDELMEAQADVVSFVLVAPSGKKFGIQSLEDFRNGQFDDLVQTATKGKSLDAVIAEKNQIVYEKREQKQQQVATVKKEIGS